MTRIVVVSRNPSLAWGLAAPERDLEEVRPHQVDAWLENPIDPQADLIVIDLTEAERSLTVLTALRANANLSPALLVAGDDPSWSGSPLHDLPGAEVLPLPVTTDALQAAVERLTSSFPFGLDVEAAEPTPPEEVVEVPQQRVDLTTPAPSLPESPPAEAALPEAVTPHPVEATPVEAAPVEAPPVPVAHQEVPAVTAPRLRRSSRTSTTVRDALAGASFAAQVAEVAQVGRGGGVVADNESPDSGPTPTAPWPVPMDRPTRPMDNANALARALTLRVDELFGIPETAEVIARDAAERTEADFAALMLPDGERWRVAAGVGLGNVERRFELAEDSWVVAHVARASKGVIVEDTDIARRPFASAPLASRRHLLAAPIRLVEGIVLVARDQDPAFTESALATLAELADEAGLLLAAALDVRELARRLQHLTDYVD